MAAFYVGWTHYLWFTAGVISSWIVRFVLENLGITVRARAHPAGKNFNRWADDISDNWETKVDQMIQARTAPILKAIEELKQQRPGKGKGG